MYSQRRASDPDLVLEAAVVGRVFERLQQAAVISHLDGHRVAVNAETQQTFKTELGCASRLTLSDLNADSE